MKGLSGIGFEKNGGARRKSFTTEDTESDANEREKNEKGPKRVDGTIAAGSLHSLPLNARHSGQDDSSVDGVLPRLKAG